MMSHLICVTRNVIVLPYILTGRYRYHISLQDDSTIIYFTPPPSLYSDN